ncbi:DsbE family thiol:disulfide interchange protein [Candidatus Methylospira mobilis]|uniref:DsbE family thiol:disulfide interchange protein n=1 Tax=Candidatus Methylospira mobilis TaxID=1808979 RepID=A0A5Q0BNF5_9GAMM|nr:DsbE family thiol:disulfide interchange protein [Candidatus Methylospira mobilis]QFY43734.1 DsbE family thiol:disulfide interchange protein [Candidatus Methylospira mobilis]WNV04721.1 DsbE family thiol:disulfide interchange protein [Candidatus Methylospira mobilis]
MRFLIPLIVFLLLSVFLAIGLTRDPHEVPSPLVGKPAPAFTLSRLDDPQRQFGSEQLKGEVSLLNVWASWCTACRQEHQILLALAGRVNVPLYGLNYKDEREAGLGWLQRLGNPYRISVSDPDGKVGMNWGVYGVPETFVIDKRGVIRYKQIGPVTEDVLEGVLLPLIRQLQAEEATA